MTLRLVAEISANCGERYLGREDVTAIEDVRSRLERGELQEFGVIGELPEPVSAQP